MAAVARVLHFLAALGEITAESLRCHLPQRWGFGVLCWIGVASPQARCLMQAIEEQQPWLDELALLRRAHACSQRADSPEGYAPVDLDELIAIAEALEGEHGWDARQVDGWLERLGLWDQDV